MPTATPRPERQPTRSAGRKPRSQRQLRPQQHQPRPQPIRQVSRPLFSRSPSPDTDVDEDDKDFLLDTGPGLREDDPIVVEDWSVDSDSEGEEDHDDGTLAEGDLVKVEDQQSPARSPSLSPPPTPSRPPRRSPILPPLEAPSSPPAHDSPVRRPSFSPSPRRSPRQWPELPSRTPSASPIRHRTPLGSPSPPPTRYQRRVASAKLDEDDKDMSDAANRVLGSQERLLGSESGDDDISMASFRQSRVEHEVIVIDDSDDEGLDEWDGEMKEAKPEIKEESDSDEDDEVPDLLRALRRREEKPKVKVEPNSDEDEDEDPWSRRYRLERLRQRAKGKRRESRAARDHRHERRERDRHEREQAGPSRHKRRRRRHDSGQARPRRRRSPDGSDDPDDSDDDSNDTSDSDDSDDDDRRRGRMPDELEQQRSAEFVRAEQERLGAHVRIPRVYLGVEVNWALERAARKEYLQATRDNSRQNIFYARSDEDDDHRCDRCRALGIITCWRLIKRQRCQFCRNRPHKEWKCSLVEPSELQAFQARGRQIFREAGTGVNASRRKLMKKISRALDKANDYREGRGLPPIGE